MKGWKKKVLGLFLAVILTAMGAVPGAAAHPQVINVMTTYPEGWTLHRPLGHADPVFRGCGLREKTQPDCLVRRELRVGAERLGGGPVPDLEVHHAEERDGRGTVDLHGYPDIQGEAAALLRRH